MPPFSLLATLFAAAVCTPAIAAVPSPTWPNGQVAWSHATERGFHPDGTVAYEAGKVFHATGRVAWTGSVGFHADGKRAWSPDPATCTDAEGHKHPHLPCSWDLGSPVRLTVDVTPGRWTLTPEGRAPSAYRCRLELAGTTIDLACGAGLPTPPPETKPEKPTSGGRMVPWPPPPKETP
jgi:hypothetical protein